jgi:hypothetical protein
MAGRWYDSAQRVLSDGLLTEYEFIDADAAVREFAAARQSGRALFVLGGRLSLHSAVAAIS